MTTFAPSVTKIGPKGSPAGHVFRSSLAYSHNMRGAFVVQLGPDSNPAERRFEGWVEEVDSCIELRFRSTEELLKFMSLRLELIRGSGGKPPACEVQGADVDKKAPQKSRKSKCR
ncbi:MAG TPA: hypothetical protein VGR58_07745 [Candidatus Acidoferrum sp.]|nr:hypothetical protein [Candidatus Acidoferrum sp.]